MTALKLGDLVVLKSGGPVMTVDAINTDIFDDSKFTGVVCVWFVGDKLERVRFDYRAVEPASLPSVRSAPQPEENPEYTGALDSMMTEMNGPPESDKSLPKRARKPVRTRTSGTKTSRIKTSRTKTEQRTPTVQPGTISAP